MDFRLTEEQEMIRDMVRDFAQNEVKPVALDYDHKTDPKECVPWDLLKKASELDHRFQQAFQQALQAPKDSDLLFLFADVGAQAAGPAPVPAPAGKQQRFARLMLVSVLGGVLVTLGLLQSRSSLGGRRPCLRQRLLIGLRIDPKQQLTG